MTYDFDRVIDRRLPRATSGTSIPPTCSRSGWPTWTSARRSPCIRALRERVEHGVFGYGVEQPEFYEVILDRLQKRYGWRVPREAILLIPGVIPGFNLAARAFTASGDGLLLQTPMYPPIRRVPENVELSSDETELTREPDGRYTIDFDRFEGGDRQAHADVPPLQSAQSGGARLSTG